MNTTPFTHRTALALLGLAAALAALPAIIARADDAAAPTTQPAQSESPATQPARRPFVGRGPAGTALWNRLFGNGPAVAQPNQPATTAERQEAAEFLRNHAPNKAALLDKMRPATRDIVLNLVAVRYRQINRFQSSDPELFGLLVRQYEVQDQVLGAMEQLGQSSPTTAPADAEQALRDKISELVDLNLQQRQARLDRLKDTLAREEDRLVRDTARRDDLVEQAFDRAKDDAARLDKRLGTMQSGSQPPATVDGAPDAQPSAAPAPDADVAAPKSPPPNH